MPKISLTKETYARVAEFKHIVEAVLQEKTSMNVCIHIILNQGMDLMLAELLGPVDPNTLLTSFQQLAKQHPSKVYRYVAETLKQGGASQEQENMRKRIGFYKREETQ